MINIQYCFIDLLFIALRTNRQQQNLLPTSTQVQLEYKHKYQVQLEYKHKYSSTTRVQAQVLKYNSSTSTSTKYYSSNYRAGAGEVAGGGGGAEGRGEVRRTDTRSVDEELVELEVVHLQADNCRHGFSPVFADHQRSAGRHQRPKRLELAATYTVPRRPVSKFNCVLLYVTAAAATVCCAMREYLLLCGCPIGRFTRLVRPSVRPSLPHALVTRKQENIENQNQYKGSPRHE